MGTYHFITLFCNLTKFHLVKCSFSQENIIKIQNINLPFFFGEGRVITESFDIGNTQIVHSSFDPNVEHFLHS